MWAQRRAISLPSGSMSGSMRTGAFEGGAQPAEMGVIEAASAGASARAAGWPEVAGAGEGGNGASATGAAAAVDMVV